MVWQDEEEKQCHFRRVFFSGLILGLLPLIVVLLDNEFMLGNQLMFRLVTIGVVLAVSPLCFSLIVIATHLIEYVYEGEIDRWQGCRLLFAEYCRLVAWLMGTASIGLATTLLVTFFQGR